MPASARAALIARTPSSRPERPGWRPNGDRPTPMIATSLISFPLVWLDLGQPVARHVSHGGQADGLPDAHRGGVRDIEDSLDADTVGGLDVDHDEWLIARCRRNVRR